MVPGFSTNSLGEIDAVDALPILHDLGYRSIAITPDRHLLNPFGAGFDAEVERWKVALAATGMGCVIETGARHLLDLRYKHEPTLVSADPGGRGRRVGFLKSAIDLAERLDAGCISIWSGTGQDSAGEAALWDRLVEGLLLVLDHAADARAGQGVKVAFEPEPGMVIDTLHRCGRLFDRLGNPEHLAVTIDIGHLECMGERPVEAVLAPWAGRIANVHVDDQLASRHEHLPLGAGDIDFSTTIGVLRAVGYAGGLHVELPRQSHRWLETARESVAVLGRLLQPSRIHFQASSIRDTSK